VQIDRCRDTASGRVRDKNWTKNPHAFTTVEAKRGKKNKIKSEYFTVCWMWIKYIGPGPDFRGHRPIPKIEGLPPKRYFFVSRKYMHDSEFPKLIIICLWHYQHSVMYFLNPEAFIVFHLKWVVTRSFNRLNPDLRRPISRHAYHNTYRMNTSISHNGITRLKQLYYLNCKY